MTWTHGASGYRSYGCRCGVCRSEHTARTQVEQQRRLERLQADPTLAEHGTVHTYRNWGCRCGPCTAANSAYSVEYKRKRRGAA